MWLASVFLAANRRLLVRNLPGNLSWIYKPCQNIFVKINRNDPKRSESQVECSLRSFGFAVDCRSFKNYVLMFRFLADFLSAFTGCWQWGVCFWRSNHWKFLLDISIMSIFQWKMASLAWYKRQRSHFLVGQQSMFGVKESFSRSNC